MPALEGKVAVVTGGNSGIGFAIAKRFVEEGAYVSIIGRRGADELDKAVSAIGQNVASVQGDISIVNPDTAFPDKISAADLRNVFAEINTKLTQVIDALPPTDLLNKHESVSEEYFAKEPLRNRLPGFEQRTAHSMFHAGQLRLVTKP